MWLRKLFARAPAPVAPEMTWYQFKPQADITVYELALILSTLRNGRGGPLLSKWMRLPATPLLSEHLSSVGIPDAIRHFEEFR